MSDIILPPGAADAAANAVRVHPDDPDYDGPEFVLRLRDDGEHIFAVGVTKPPLKPGDPLTVPCHMVGAYIANNFGSIVEAAERWFKTPHDEVTGEDEQSSAVTEPETIPMIEAKQQLLDAIEADAARG